MKKISLALLVASSFSQISFAEKAEPLSALEVADPDLPGGSYDTRIELQRKVDQVTNLSLQPSQYNDIKEVLLGQLRANASPYTSIATPVTRSLNVRFTPGLTPPVIRLSANMLSTIVFSDAVGNPWNISNVAMNRVMFSNGSDVSQQVQASGAQDDTTIKRNLNILSLEPLNPVAYGNVAVTLEGLDTPVIFILSTGQAEVDLRVDARLPGLNPNREVKEGFSSAKGVSTIDETTLLFVDGSPPKDAAQLKSSSPDVEAWNFSDELVVRTDAQIIYPAYIASVTSASGMTVYRFAKETQAITVSKGTTSKNIFFEEQ